MTKPTEDTIARVRLFYTSGYGAEYIQRVFDVSPETFDAIIRGQFGRGKIGNRT